MQTGCELWLFQERKVGNMDCTFCLDCIQACPYDNVGIQLRAPTSEFGRLQEWHSGVGTLVKRTDIAALVIVLVFAAFVNAFGMVAPVYAWNNGWPRCLASAVSHWCLAWSFL